MASGTRLARTLAIVTKSGLRKVTGPAYWYYEKRLSKEVLEKKVPTHIALILDGNRRFAQSIGLDVSKGHEYGIARVHDLLDWSFKLGIRNITIFAFSMENFERAPHEVEVLLELLIRECQNLVDHPLIKSNHVRVKVIGQKQKFPADVQAALRELETSTATHGGLLLNIALAYGGRQEITDAVRNMLRAAALQGLSATQVAETLTPTDLGRYLYTVGTPDPDFIIRTSGEQRLSGFLLWQAAYSEYYFCDALWPEFRRIDFLRAIRDYQKRQRRFGR